MLKSQSCDHPTLTAQRDIYMVGPLYTPNTCLSILLNYMGNERNGKEVGEIALVEQKPIGVSRRNQTGMEIKITVSKPGVEEVCETSPCVRLHCTGKAVSKLSRVGGT